MSNERVTYSEEDLDEIIRMSSDNADSVEPITGLIQTFTNGLDRRVADYYGTAYDALANNDFAEKYQQAKDFLEWIEANKEAIIEMEEEQERRAGDSENGGGGGSDYTPPVNPDLPSNENVDDIKIDPEKVKEWPEELKTKVVEELRDAGYTDEEIEDILDGNVPVDKYTTEKIQKALEDAIKDNPDLAKRIEEATGFSILDENGEVDIDRLAIMELIAAKNLGMDIDMRPGTPFKKHINELTLDLQREYRKDPSIRQKIIDLYGIDIFDDNGKIDQDKLALIRVIDGQDLNDEFDITKLLGQDVTEPNEVPPTQAPSTPPPTQGPVDVPTTPPTQAPSTPPPPTSTPTTPPYDSPDSDSKPQPPTTPTRSDIVAPVGPNTNENPENVLSKVAHTVTSSIKGGTEALGSGILDALGKGAATISKGIAPYKGVVGGTGSAVNVNSATAGIIAAASVAAGGAAAGGGLLAHKKMSMLRFTPEDWKALGEDYQTIIEKLMKKVGFTEDELETFKNSRFKVPTSEIKEHVKKIEKAMDLNPTCDDELLKLYDFTFLDENQKVIDYLLFITMIIDGKNTIDDYNMYNVINQSFENVDEADFIYSGINMEDYYDENGPEEEEEIKILNDPTEPKEETATDETTPEGEEQESNELDEAFAPGIDKDWLKGIGIDD